MNMAALFLWRKEKIMKASNGISQEQNILCMVNQISGVYTAPLIDGVSAMCDNSDTLEYLYQIMDTLAKHKEYASAFLCIRFLYAVTKEDVPDVLEKISEQSDKLKMYICEFMEDFFDILQEYRH